ncbi:MAG: response regulator transcription factor [Candidatus Obscuribacterales bacterium]|nr:response regulator transcription factor [Candidatus Obscuribacterales bacterium]
MSKVLLVEDDKEFAESLSAVLKAARFSVDHVESAEDAFMFLSTYSYELAVLDWELPGESGPEFCKKMKVKFPETHVIMLTGKSGTGNTVSGLDAGADDYVEKPCNTDELLARIRSLLRRKSEGKGEDLLSCGFLTIRESSHQAEFRNVSLQLSAREFELLKFFLRHPDSYFTSESLFLRIWPSKSEISNELVRMYVKKLRDKLIEAAGFSPIETRAGKGYALSSKLCATQEEHG